MKPQNERWAALTVVFALCSSCVSPRRSPQRDLRDIQDEASSASAELLYGTWGGGAWGGAGWSRLLKISLSSLPQAIRVVAPVHVRREAVHLVDPDHWDPRVLAVALGRLSVADDGVGVHLARTAASYISAWKTEHALPPPAANVVEMLLLSQLNVIDAGVGGKEFDRNGDLTGRVRALREQLVSKDDAFWRAAYDVVPGSTCYVLVACVDDDAARETGNKMLAEALHRFPARDWPPIELHLAACAAAVTGGPTLYDAGGALYRAFRSRYLRLRTQHRLSELAMPQQELLDALRETEKVLEDAEAARVIYLWLDGVLLFNEGRHGRATAYP